MNDRDLDRDIAECSAAFLPYYPEHLDLNHQSGQDELHHQLDTYSEHFGGRRWNDEAAARRASPKPVCNL